MSVDKIEALWKEIRLAQLEQRGFSNKKIFMSIFCGICLCLFIRMVFWLEGSILPSSEINVLDINISKVRLECHVKKDDNYIYFVKQDRKLVPIYKSIPTWNGDGIILNKNDSFFPISKIKYDGIMFYEVKPTKFIPKSKMIECW